LGSAKDDILYTIVGSELVRPNRKACILFLVLLASSPILAQVQRGSIQLTVLDNSGAALRASGTLISEVNGFQRDFETNDQGQHIARDLPFGVYRMTVSSRGFALADSLVKVNSQVPIKLNVTLAVAQLTTKVEVNDSATLINPYEASTIYSDGQRTIREQLSTTPGRKISDLVNAQPGWLYEANGVLHPRGSEYDVQFVRDGIPLTENRSPAFAAPFEQEDVESLQTRTGGYPAEYGRKMGGVVEIATRSDAPSGLHGQAVFSGGSFSTAVGDLGLTYAEGENQYSFNVTGALTDRYLDSPVLNNFSNHGSLSGFSFSYARQLTPDDHLRLSLAHNSVAFQVPNELVQQDAGQLQGRGNLETSGDVSYSHVVSSSLLLSVAGSMRDTAEYLSSNQFSTPIIAGQKRGFREGYVRVDLAGQKGRHSWKVGADGVFSNIYEKLQYQITDPEAFDIGVEPTFNFSDRGRDREQSFFAQDQIRLGNWNISLGARFDHYHLAIDRSAWSPRAAVSRYFPSLGLLVHASYDRIFQTPAVENILLASSPQVDQVSGAVLRVPVPVGHANFYEAGLTKAILGKVSFTANAFRRNWQNFSDDDVLLNTGVSFPLSFSSAWIKGIETKVVVQNLGNVSGYVSYANQVAVGQGPITGGLFLGDEAQDALTDNSRFPVSQDQRNTLRARVRYQIIPRAWTAVGYSFGSGLPVEDEGGDLDLNFLLAQYGPQILNRVNFAARRVRPSFALNVGGGVELFHRDRKSVSFAAQVSNLTNRVNVINFASLFSGTAVAAGRTVTMQLKTEF
jgi:hypothetical protein